LRRSDRITSTSIFSYEGGFPWLTPTVFELGVDIGAGRGGFTLFLSAATKLHDYPEMAATNCAAGAAQRTIVGLPPGLATLKPYILAPTSRITAEVMIPGRRSGSESPRPAPACRVEVDVTLMASRALDVSVPASPPPGVGGGTAMN